MSPRPTRKPKKDRKPRQTTGPVTLPADDAAFVREDVVLGVYPLGKTSLWNAIAAGEFPRPIKISKRTNAWNVGQLRRLLASRLDPHTTETDRE